jgi:hypothetical protein
VVGPWLLDPSRRERRYRQEFFTSAFKALRFNGIDGDYAEFGSAACASGERRAMLELAAADDAWEWVPYVQFGWHGQSFVNELRELR